MKAKVKPKPKKSKVEVPKSIFRFKIEELAKPTGKIIPMTHRLKLYERDKCIYNILCASELACNKVVEHMKEAKVENEIRNTRKKTVRKK